MKRIAMTASLAALALAAPIQAADNDVAALTEEAAGIVSSFAGEMKGALSTAMQEDGPVHAIGVCNVDAPEIAAAAEAASGWTVARSSHKLRNPKNAPDAYVQVAIDDFLAREAAGEAVKDFAKAEIVEQDGQKMFRFIKAIPTGTPCLNCHGGDDVKPEVVEKLAELYPEDQARGFTLGQMRGVFTLTKPLSE